MNNKTATNRNIRLFLLGGLLGALAFVCIFGIAPLDVTNDIFCRGGFVEKDIQQHYAGWLFLRQSPLSFPFCIAQGINYPGGISVAYTDSIPLFAAFFRLLNSFLPETFQYFGLFSLLCYFLQGGFAALLLGLFSGGTVLPVVGSLFFSCSPILVERTLRHTSLAAHFFILAALYYYFRSVRENKISYPLLWVLNALTITVHPYLVPMTYAVTFAMVVSHGLRSKKWGAPLLFLISDLAATVLLGWCFGVFGSGGTGGSELLYGYFSMNLNALWNPVSINTVWSSTLPVQNQIRGNYDSFNYLGQVILYSAFVETVFRIMKPRQLVETMKRHAVLLFVFLCLFVFAVTNQVTANGAALFTVPLPNKLLALCSVFRASGRMFWPVYYFIFLFAVHGLFTVARSEKSASILLCGAVALQLLDLSPALLARHREMSAYREEYPSEMVGTFWQKATDYKHIFSLDELQEDALHLALWASDNGMTTNDPFAARFDAVSLQTAREQAMQSLMNGELSADTLYLCHNEDTFLSVADQISDKAWCGIVDGKWYVVAPGMEGWQSDDAVSYGADYPLTIADYTDDNWNHGVLSWDGCTVIFYDVPFIRAKLENAAEVIANGQSYGIVKFDDHDAGWIMVTLDTADASPLCGEVLTTR